MAIKRKKTLSLTPRITWAERGLLSLVSFAEVLDDILGLVLVLALFLEPEPDDVLFLTAEVKILVLIL